MNLTTTDQAQRSAPKADTASHVVNDIQLVSEERMASMLDITERCLRDWRRRRVVPFVKYGRTVLFDPRDVVAQLKKNHGRLAVA